MVVPPGGLHYGVTVVVVVRPWLSTMTKNITWEKDQVWCFRLWLINPIGARETAATRTLVSFLSRCQRDRFEFAPLTLPLSPFCSKRTVSLLTLLRQAGRSRARVSQVSPLYVKSFSATLWDSPCSASFFHPMSVSPTGNGPHFSLVVRFNVIT